MLEVINPVKEDNTLRIFEERSRAWLENSPVCTKVVDPDFNLLYMSKAGIEALQIANINDHYGKQFPLAFYPISFKESMCNTLQAVKDTGEVMLHEDSITTSDGKVLWYESTISPIYTKEGVLDYFMVVSLEISKRKQAEANDTLLKEIHHRIKNNLQIVSSLLSLQSSEVEDQKLKEIIQNSQQRISTISLVHEKIYQSNSSDEISVKEYIEGLISNISATYSSDHITVKEDIQIDDFHLNMDVLVPISLILNEIITNIFKYGLESNSAPYMKIHISKVEDNITISIADNGPGMIHNSKGENGSSLGLKLIDALATQIKATIDTKSAINQGVNYTIKFKL